MDGEMLLSQLSTAQRGELLALTRSTYDAIDALNAADAYGKACCWLSRDDAPQTALEQLVSVIGEHDIRASAALPGGSCDLSGVAGYEWWLQIRPPASGQPFHHDTDWNDHDAGLSPSLSFSRCSSVTYLSDAGGPLVVLVPHDAAIEPKRAHARHSDEYDRALNATLRAPHGAYVSAPLFGKHVRFRGSLYHGVLEQHAAAERHADDRIALVVAYWAAPLRRIHRFPREHFARQLSRHAPSGDGANADARLSVAKRSLSTIEPFPYAAASPDATCATAAFDGATSLDFVTWSRDDEEPIETSTRRTTHVSSLDALTRSRFSLRLPTSLAPGASVFVADVGMSTL